MKYKLLKEEYKYNGFLKIKKAEIEYESFNSDLPIKTSRECLERGDSVAILFFEKDTDSFVFTNQFRYPTIRNDSGWIIEIVAGMIDKGETPLKSAIREIKEELGYATSNLKLISEFYTSPGGSSEKIVLFYTEVNSTDKIENGGGIESESEDIQVIKIKKSKIKELLKQNYFIDAKTIIAIQNYFLWNY